jgi:Flp pilus assembly protein TadG
MRKRPFRIDISGATALEFALCAPAFFALVMGIVQLGILVWMQLALQQGVEAAARCASVNKNACASASQVQAFAAAQSFGLSPPSSSFTVTAPACGNMVQASYTPTYLPSFPIPTRTLTAQACFPS